MLDERAEYIALALLDGIPEDNEVDGDVVLLDAFGQTGHELLVRGLTLEGRRDKDDDALPQVGVRPVLECEEGFLNGVWEVDRAAELLLGGADGVQYRTDVLGICYKYIDTRAYEPNASESAAVGVRSIARTLCRPWS